MGDKFFYAEKVSEIVTEKILKQLKQGIIPWRQSWKDAIPRNWETNRPYNGINLFLLAPGEYLTFNQIKKLNARLKKGAKGYLVVFWKVDTIKAEKKNDITEPEEEETVIEEVATKEEVKKVYLLKYYYVFNVNDIEGLPQKKGKEQDIPQDMPVVKEVDYKNKVKHALEFVKQWNNIVPIKHGNYNPCYSPINDTIYMPYFSHFEDKNKIEEYFSTLFHEIVHSTGHQSRLDRIKHNKIGDWHYSLEELTAEIGSSMLMNMYGLDIPEVFQNNVAYINFWLQQLNNDKTLIIKAAGRAETAVEYVLQKTKFGENEVEKPKEVATA